MASLLVPSPATTLQSYDRLPCQKANKIKKKRGKKNFYRQEESTTLFGKIAGGEEPAKKKDKIER